MRCRRGAHQLRGDEYISSASTRREIFEILLNQPEIRLCLQFSDRFGSERKSVWIQINRKMVNTTWLRVGLIRFRKYLFVWIISKENKVEKFISDTNFTEFFPIFHHIWFCKYIHQIWRVFQQDNTYQLYGLINRR